MSRSLTRVTGRALVVAAVLILALGTLAQASGPPVASVWGTYTYSHVGGAVPTRADHVTAIGTDPVTGTWARWNLESGVFRSGAVTCLVVEGNEAFMFGPGRVGGRGAFLWVRDDPAGDSAVLFVQDLAGDPGDPEPQTLEQMEGWCLSAGATYPGAAPFPLISGNLTVIDGL